MPAQSLPTGTGRPRGFAAWRLIVVAAVFVVLLAGGLLFWHSRAADTPEADPLLCTVERSCFVHEITERGNVESASNIEIRCEVQAKNSQGTTILWVIPEGTYVEKGQKLCELDSSALEDDKLKQEIVCSNSEAALIKARNDFDSAKIAKQEYEEGTFKETEQQLLSDQSTAEENRRRARDYLLYSERLYNRGYATKFQFEADKFALDKADTDFEVAQTKLMVLRQFTRAKMLNQLESAIATTEAALKAADRSHQLDVQQLALIKSQIEKCVISAPEPGQVVYANETGNRGGKDIIIAEGELVRERQVIIRLPDPKRMQVKAKINEAGISLVARGQRATIRMDAFPDVELSGLVEKVNEYPAPTSWFNPNVKEYETIVRVNETPEGLRPGLTAEVKILVEQIDDAIHVPVQAVIEYGGKHFCAVRDGSAWKARPVDIGATNDKTVVIRAGLDVGEQIALNAPALRGKLDLPELPAEPARGAPAPATPALAAANNDGARGPKGVGTAESANPAAYADRLFHDYDRNHDGRIEIERVPEPLRTRLRAADSNSDGRLDRVELNAAVDRLMRHGTAGSPGSKPALGAAGART